MDKDTTFTIDEVAEILKVSAQTVRNLIKQKKLKVFRVGVQIRIRKADLDQFMTQQSD